MYSLIGLGTAGLKSSCQQGPAPSQGPRIASFLVSFWHAVVSGSPWLVAASLIAARLHITIFLLCVLVSVSGSSILSLVYKGRSHWLLGLTNPGCSHLNQIASAKNLFPNRVTPEVPGGHELWGDTI